MSNAEAKNDKRPDKKEPGPTASSVTYQFSIKSAGSWQQKSKNLKIFYLLFSQRLTPV